MTRQLQGTVGDFAGIEFKLEPDLARGRYTTRFRAFRRGAASDASEARYWLH